jgi:Ca2+-binding EF-hand superfamily protein
LLENINVTDRLSKGRGAIKEKDFSDFLERDLGLRLTKIDVQFLMLTYDIGGNDSMNTSIFIKELQECAKKKGDKSPRLISLLKDNRDRNDTVSSRAITEKQPQA